MTAGQITWSAGHVCRMLVVLTALGTSVSAFPTVSQGGLQIRSMDLFHGVEGVEPSLWKRGDPDPDKPGSYSTDASEEARRRAVRKALEEGREQKGIEQSVMWTGTGTRSRRGSDVAAEAVSKHLPPGHGTMEQQAGPHRDRSDPSSMLYGQSRDDKKDFLDKASNEAATHAANTSRQRGEPAQLIGRPGYEGDNFAREEKPILEGSRRNSVSEGAATGIKGYTPKTGTTWQKDDRASPERSRSASPTQGGGGLCKRREGGACAWPGPRDKPTTSAHKRTANKTPVKGWGGRWTANKTPLKGWGGKWTANKTPIKGRGGRWTANKIPVRRWGSRWSANKTPVKELGGKGKQKTTGTRAQWKTGQSPKSGATRALGKRPQIGTANHQSSGSRGKATAKVSAAGRGGKGARAGGSQQATKAIREQPVQKTAGKAHRLGRSTAGQR